MCCTAAQAIIDDGGYGTQQAVLILNLELALPLWSTYKSVFVPASVPVSLMRHTITMFKRSCLGHWHQKLLTIAVVASSRRAVVWAHLCSANTIHCMDSVWNTR